MVNPWDFLRPFDQIATNVLPAIVIIGLVFSIIIFAIALKAYSRAKSKKLLFVAGAFFLFMVKWAIQSIDMFVSPGLFFSVPAQAVVEIIIMVLLIAAIFKK